MAIDLLINADIPDLDQAIAFYTAAFDLTVTRRFAEVAELSGWPVKLYLIQKPAGSLGAGDDARRYVRHWTPVHFDVVVDRLDDALERAISAGAKVEIATRVEAWGKIAVLADPFGHGFCLIEFLGRGYDEITPSAPNPPAR